MGGGVKLIETMSQNMQFFFFDGVPIPGDKGTEAMLQLKFSSNIWNICIFIYSSIGKM